MRGIHSSRDASHICSSFSCCYWLKIRKFFEGFLYPKRAKGACRIVRFKSRRVSQHPCQAQEVTKTMVNRAIAVTMDELAEKEPSLHLRQMRLSDAAKEVSISYWPGFMESPWRAATGPAG